MQKILNIVFILALIILAIVAFMQYRAIQKLMPAASNLNPDGTPKRVAGGDWIDQLGKSAQKLNVEVTY